MTCATQPFCVFYVLTVSSRSLDAWSIDEKVRHGAAQTCMARETHQPTPQGTCFDLYHWLQTLDDSYQDEGVIHTQAVCGIHINE